MKVTFPIVTLSIASLLQISAIVRKLEGGFS